jgi:hypothetical protein
MLNFIVENPIVTVVTLFALFHAYSFLAENVLVKRNTDDEKITLSYVQLRTRRERPQAFHFRQSMPPDERSKLGYNLLKLEDTRNG